MMAGGLARTCRNTLGDALMHYGNSPRIAPKLRILLSLVALLLSSFAMAQSSPTAQSSPYALEILNIKPAGTGNPPIPASNRIFHAYPGIEYNIRAAVIGGVYPYTFSLSGAPAGMTINPNTGEISWPNPTSDAGPITLTVRDSTGRTVQTSWSISVHTSGFWFVDGDYTGVSTGSITQPFKTLNELVQATDGRPNDIVYIRESARPYTVVNYPSGPKPSLDGDGSLYINVSEYGGTNSAETWLAYPGEQPVIDLQNKFFLRTDRPYFDGLTILNGREYSLKTLGGTHYKTIRRSKWIGVEGATSTNRNQGFVFAIRQGDGYNFVIQDNEWSRFKGAQAIGSLYRTHKTLIENNHIFDGGQSGLHSFTTQIGLKETCLNATIRANFIEIPADANGMEIYNYASDEGALDFSYNRIIRATPGVALKFWDPEDAYIYRNTIVGDIDFTPGSGPEASQGPIYLFNNVIQGSLSDATYVTLRDNLMGGSGLVDSRGNLTSAYAQYRGSRGYEIGPPQIIPEPPQLVSVR
jgi:hypothetical protein